MLLYHRFREKTIPAKNIEKFQKSTLQYFFLFYTKKVIEREKLRLQIK